MKLRLRTKLMFFAALIAALPLVVAGQSIIRVAQDELKSSANEQLAVTARQLSDEFNAFFEYSQFTSLDLIRNAIGGNKLGLESKIALLQQGIADLPDVVSLQVNVAGAPRPIVVAREDYLAQLKTAAADPMSVLRIDDASVDIDEENIRRSSDVTLVSESGDWLATAGLPIPDGIGGRVAVLHARINLKRLSDYVINHPFAQTGTIQVVDENRTVVFSTTDGQYDHSGVMDTAVEILKTASATIAIKPFELADGSISLGAIARTRAFPWAIIVEKAEADAYRTVADMSNSLLSWLGIGILAALAGAFIFAQTISRPILTIGRSALEVARGNLKTRVTGVRSKDEIGELANQFNDMIVQLNERFELQKFVSAGTMEAIKTSDGQQVSLGGERRRAAMWFADIRGYTAYSESRDPEEVVEMLNMYFQRISDIVLAHQGDIDKFVGDEIMAVFHGAEMEDNATRCAFAVMEAMEQLAAKASTNLRMGIGIDVGDVVVGAMGSNHRKDYTVLGDHVNTAARLCSAAAPDETLVTADVFVKLRPELQAKLFEQTPLAVKGKSQSLRVYSTLGTET
jgi:adenylate cyclase